MELDITQIQKEYITIRDHEGKKNQQVVEYEWKPLYCETYKKMTYL